LCCKLAEHIHASTIRDKVVKTTRAKEACKQVLMGALEFTAAAEEKVGL
jgi:hypothetical protein